METPGPGRAIINQNFNGVEIIIPASRASAFLVRTVGALGLSAILGYYVWSQKVHSDQSWHIDGLAIFMFSLVGIGVLFMLYGVWWAFVGKEIITVADGIINIEKKNSIEKAVSYDLHSATNFRAVEEVIVTERGRQFYDGLPWQVAVKGTVKFDYGVDTIQFGDQLSETEGNYILGILRAKKLID